MVYDPDATILHYEFGSSAATSDALRLQAANLSVFKAQARGLAARPVPRQPANVLAARTGRSTRPRILVLEDRVPKPELGAGYPRSNLLLHELLEAGADVTLFPMYPAQGRPGPASRRVLDKRIEVLLHAEQSQLGSISAPGRASSTPYLVCRPHNMRAFLDAVGPERNLLGGAKIFYDAEALFAGRERSAARWTAPRSPTPSATSSSPKRSSSPVSPKPSCPWPPQEQATLEDYGARDVRLLGHAFEDDPTDNRPGRPHQIAFVGTIQDDYAPNADAVRWFATEILPLLREELAKPDIRLTVIGGANGPAIKRARTGRMLDLVGIVDELGPALASARVLVVPTRFAAGIPHKVHHAAMLGIPMVVTGLIADQLGWHDGDEFLVADEAAAFATAVRPPLWRQSLWEPIRAARSARVQAMRLIRRERFRQQRPRAGASDPDRAPPGGAPPPPRPAAAPTRRSRTRAAPQRSTGAVAVPFGFPPRAQRPRGSRVICHLFHLEVAPEVCYYLQQHPRRPTSSSPPTPKLKRPACNRICRLRRRRRQHPRHPQPRPRHRPQTHRFRRRA